MSIKWRLLRFFSNCAIIRFFSILSDFLSSDKGRLIVSGPIASLVAFINSSGYFFRFYLNGLSGLSNFTHRIGAHFSL